MKTNVKAVKILLATVQFVPTLIEILIMIVSVLQDFSKKEKLYVEPVLSNVDLV